MLIKKTLLVFNILCLLFPVAYGEENCLRPRYLHKHFPSSYSKKLRVGFGASLNQSWYLNPPISFYPYNGGVYLYNNNTLRTERGQGQSFELIACYNTHKKADWYFGFAYMQKSYHLIGAPVDKPSIPAEYRYDTINRYCQFTGVHIPLGIRYYYLEGDKSGAYIAGSALLEVAKLRKIFLETIDVNGQKKVMGTYEFQNERYPFLLLSGSVGFDIHIIKGYQLNPEVYVNYPLQQGKNTVALASAGIRLIIIQQ